MNSWTTYVSKTMDASKIQTKSFPEMLVVSRKVYLSMSWVALRIDLACLHRGIRQLHIGKDTQTQNMSTGTLYTAKLPRPASTIIITFKKWTVMEFSNLKSDIIHCTTGPLK